jgi:chromosomal replication initiation ATPase DnaA
MHNLGGFDGFLLITHFTENLRHNLKFVKRLDSFSDLKNKYIQIEAVIFGIKFV